MSIDFTTVPHEFRESAIRLSENIDFSSVNDKGANGTILIGTNKILHRQVVVKFYYWGNGAHVEPKLLSQLESEHILPVFHAEKINKDYALFVTPYCAMVDLDDGMARGRFGPVEAVDALIQIASGVSYLHGRRFLHRDLKPANVFCDSDGKFVIGDFGSVVSLGANEYSQTVTRHSLLYRSPEEIALQRTYERSDVYQLGLVFYQLLGGLLSYEERDWLTPKQLRDYNAKSGWDRQDVARAAIEDRIQRGKIIALSSLPCWVPSKLKSIIRKCCNVNKDERFESAAALIAKLNNVRGSLPDWKIAEHPILHTPRVQFRIVQKDSAISIEKKVKGAEAWRVERNHKPTNLQDAVAIVENLS